MIPDHVVIGGKRIEVIEDPDCVEYGTFSPDEWIIRLGPSAKVSPLETLRHEMIHAAFAVAGISHLRRFEEEAVVRCLDNILFPALPQLRSFESSSEDSDSCS